MDKTMVGMFFAGTESGLLQYQAHEALTIEKMAGSYDRTIAGGADDEEMPYLLSVENGIGVITIAGAMTNRDSWFNQIMGVASYAAIREAVVYAAESPDVKEIVLNINSGGGPVNGVSDTARLIAMVNDKVKPVTAYSDGKIQSAAYWLASSAGAIYASNVSELGSIGVLAVHQEVSEMQKAAGVTTTVIRAGKFKALVNPHEKLTAEALAEVEGQLEAVYKVFVQHVATALNQPYDYVDQTMAQGREFVGEQALAVGLVNGITTYDDVLSRIENKSLDNRSQLMQTFRNPNTGGVIVSKKALTEGDIAAIAAGATIVASTASAPAAEDEAAEAQGSVAEAAATATDVKVMDILGKTDIQAYLQSQIADKDATILAQGVHLSSLEAKLADQSASFSALVAIAATSCNNMRIALGGTAVDMSGQTAVAVLADHDKVSAQFMDKFKAGGVASVDASANNASEAPEVDHLFHLRVASFATHMAK